uniref:Sorting nexin-2 n=1 Tax=Hippocampus comes TaxID=109280 RepID=A0A3Q2YA82_HIPCM
MCDCEQQRPLKLHVAFLSPSFSVTSPILTARKMASGTSRNPPPFPTNDETGEGLSNLADGDSDEGEDIFVSNVSSRVLFYLRSPVIDDGMKRTRILLMWTLLSPTLRKSVGVFQVCMSCFCIFSKYLIFCIHFVSILPGDGMNAYVAYRVSTRTSLPMFKNRTFSVRRRFSDFLGLYEKLSVKQSLHGCIIPLPPEKSVVGMTKVKVGMDDPSSVEFVERRRAALERYLQRVVAHPLLIQDPDVREFLEKEDLPRASNTQALSGAGFLKMINKASEAVNKMTIKMNESDTWFEDKLQEVENEEQQLRKLHAVVDSLVNHRKELCGNTAVFAKSMAMLGNSEDNTALSRALSQLAEVEDKMEQLHQEQASSDFFIFAEVLADYIRLLGAVRGCFDQRMRAWQRWQEAQSSLQKKREVEAKLLWANKPDKLQQAKEEITEWEAKVTQYERDFDRIGMTVRKEVLRFEKEKTKDLKTQIIKYLESMLQSQQRLIKFWEAFLPEAKAIA